MSLEGIHGNSMQSEANALFVNDTNIFVVGSIGKVATLWKNGKLFNLTDGVNYAEATSVIVSDTNVYIAINDGKKATIWNNGVITLLKTVPSPNPDYRDDFSKIKSLFISGNDLYAVGYDYIASNLGPTAKIWKNGIGTLLSNFDNASEANSIYVIDNDVYVVGSKSYFKGYGFEDVATVWKNGKEVALYAEGSKAKSVVVTNK